MISSMSAEEENEKYLLKALQMLIQDLAERILHNHLENPRIINDLTESKCEIMAEKVISITAEGITSRTIRKLKKGEEFGSISSRDTLAAAWFHKIKGIEKRKINLNLGGSTDGYWDKYVDTFRGMKKEISNFLGKTEGINLEFQDNIVTIPNLSMMICSFANKEGGYIIFGVGTDNTTLVGIDSDKPLIKQTDAALGRFGDIQPKIEFGWGYYYKEKKILFVIRIYKTNSNKPFKLNGIIYIRDGSSYKTINENNRINESPKNELATRSRIKLIENIRQIKSIVDDHLNYYNIYKDSKVGITSDDEKRTFFVISLKFISDTFITYLLDIWKEVSHKKINIKLPGSLLFLYAHVEEEIDNSIKELKEGNVNSFLKDIEAIPEIHKIITSKIDFLTRLILNPVNEITSTEVYDAISLVSDLARQIDFDTNKKFHLIQTQVRIQI